MDRQKIKAAAQLLLAARNHEVSLARLPDAHFPTNVAEAYAIQDEVMRALGPVGGWKMGALGAGTLPSCAPIPAQYIFAAPYHFFDLLMTGSRGIEVGIALCMKHDLPLRATPYGRHEVLAAVASVHPAIEVASSRYSEAPAGQALAGLADALSNCAVIYGPGRSDLRQIERGLMQTELYFNGLEPCEVAPASPPAPASAPLDIWPQVVWLANHLGTRCGGLKAGQFITAGAHGGWQSAATGSKAFAKKSQREAAAMSLVQA